jgi:hypothetical protein
MQRRHGSGVGIRRRKAAGPLVGAAVTAVLLGGLAGPVGAVDGQDPASSDVAESTTTSEAVPSTTAPPTTAAPATTTTEAAPPPTTAAPAPAVVEEEEEVEPTTTVVDEEVEEEPASTTTAETTATVVRRAPIPSTTEAVPSTTEASRSGRGSVGSTREEGTDDDSQQVVRLVIGLLVVVALLIAVLTWRYWRYTDPRRGYAPSRARLPGGGPEPPGTALASEPTASGATVVPAPPQPVGVASGGAVGAASGGAVGVASGGAVGVASGGAVGAASGDAATDGPASVFDGLELYGAGRTALPQDIDPTDPGPGAMGFARQPERVGGPDPGKEAAPADGADPGR